MIERGPVATHPDGTPERLGRYRLLRPISTGGMARVFEGRRESLAGVAPRVAIKVILPDYASDEGFRDLFVNEARIGALLQHQNLVQIQDFDSDGGLYYLVMEYVEGVTVRRTVSLCRKHGIAPAVSVIAEIGRQVCDGLHHAHTATSEDGRALHLVHRDIKPSNLMLNPQGVVKILDFGISHALINRERKGAVRGTWGYMAPEQAEGVGLGPATDLFGLAAVLYEMAALEALFPEKEPDEIRGLLDRDEAARRASQLSGSMSPLAGVLIRALQRDPAARFTSAAAMARTLGALVVDPVTAREQLVQFQSTIADLARPGGPATADHRGSSSTFDRQGALSQPGRASGVPSSGSPVSAAAASRGHAPGRSDPAVGLPVFVGKLHGPEPAVGPVHLHEPEPDAVPAPAPSWLQALGAALFVIVAFAVVTFTAWQLVGHQEVRPPVPPPRPVENPLAGVVGDEDLLDVPILDAPILDAPEAPAPDPAAMATPPEDVVINARIAPPEQPVEASPPAGDVLPREAPAPVEPDPRSPPDLSLVIPPPPQGADPTSTTAQRAVARTTGRLTVSSIPRAQVVIDGRFVRYSPLFRFEVEAGTRSITLITDDKRSATFRVDVPAGGEVRRVWSFDEGNFTGGD